MRVLQLSTHSTLRPSHGGKLRSHHIGRVLEEAGFDLSRIAFCYRVPDDLDDPREPIIDIARLRYWERPEFHPAFQYLSDYIPTLAALKDQSILQEFDNLVHAANPEVVLLEHPWTWPLLARHAKVRSGEIKVIYSSQNVETPLKKQILAQEGIAPPPGLLEGVENLEHDLVAHAAAVCCCTQADAEIFTQWGARRVVVAPNGGARRKRDHLIDILPWPLAPGQPYALVVGSGHPPNISGFMDLVAPALPRLAVNQRVVVAGGAGNGILQALAAKGLQGLIENRLIVLGTIDEFCLDCTIGNAHVVLLPIQYGGGSNVKTVEALLSGRPTIASEAAMRGFSEFSQAPGFRVAGDPASFAGATLDALSRPFQARVPDFPALSSLLWESTIDPIVRLIRGF